MKKILCILLLILILAPPVFAEEISDLFYEVKAQHPDIVLRLNAGGASDEDIISFLNDVEECLYIIVSDLNEENYDDAAMQAINQAIMYTKNLPVYEALTKQFTEEALYFIVNDTFPPSLMPFYNTVKQKVLATFVPYTLFRDESEFAWAFDAISYLSSSGIITGYEDKTFRGNNNITRAEFAKIAVAAFGLFDDTAEESFDDVSASDWYAPYIASAQKAGIIKGYSDSVFAPNELIKRQDISLIIYNIKFSGEAAPAAFDDAYQISDYAKNAVGVMQREGIIRGMGDNLFAPLSNATRAQVAQIVYNAM